MRNDELHEAINCPLCGESTYKVIYTPSYSSSISKEDLLKIYCSSSDEKLLDQLVQCSECSLIYLNPRTNPSILIKSYSEAVDPTFVKQDQKRIQCFSKELKQIINQFRIIPSKDKRVLDIGCAGGAFLKAAHDIGFDVTGIEPSSWMCEYGRKEYGLDLRQGQLADNDFEPESFDIITLWDVLEHLTNPSDVLKNVSALLKKDGRLIINYPDYGSFVARILGQKWPFLLSVHLIYYDRCTIKRQLEQCGFCVEQIKPFWQVLELGYVMYRASNYFRIFKFLGNIISFLGIYSIPLKYNMGQTRVIAKKS